MSRDQRLQELTRLTESLRKRIANAEAADKPYARDPIAQTLKSLLNDVDAMVAEEKKRT